MANEKKLKWKESVRSDLFKTPVFTVQKILSISPEGRGGEYITLNAPDWVIVIPVLKNAATGKPDFVMVRQWRHGAGEICTEFPGGVMEKNEKPETAAGRELLEETGYRAGKLVHLGTVSPNPAIMSNRVHFFAAEDLTDTGETSPDEDEYVNTSILSGAEVFKKMGHGDFTHSLMSTALLLYLQHNPALIK
ncbi:MAG: NUDIX hydrolase [Spirochaetaceae bacterium]|jgi:ADP-ribose pyrophosphatase YjhB (NUDIX family)|nr:NUDIX hydrolase [Spirochaetaceae bacterium]